MSLLRGVLIRGRRWVDSDDSGSAPTSGDFGGVAGYGDLLVDALTGAIYVNQSETNSPSWGLPAVLASSVLIGGDVTLSRAAAGILGVDRVRLADGTAASPALQFDDAAGIYESSAGTLAFACGGATPVTISNTQINLSRNTVLVNGTGTELLFSGDEQTDIKSDHTMVFTCDRDNDASGACTLEFWGGASGMRMRIHDGIVGSSYVIQLGADTDTPAEQQIKTGDGATNASGSDFHLKPGEAAGTDIAGADLILSGGQCTGAGAGGTILFQTAAAGGSGTTVRSLVTRMTLSSGALTFAEGIDLVAGTTTGSQIGQTGGAAGEKWAFFGATPIVQPVLATGGGATVDNVITMLQNLGLCRQA